ncbi:MAG: hypothetical protein WCJ32_08095 [Actinomycetota bacterium]
MFKTRLVLVALFALFGLSSCGKTIIDTTITEAPNVAVTTTLPTGSAAELLPRLVAEAGKLSDLIGTAGAKNDQMQLINNLWAAARAEVTAADADIADTFDAAIELCTKGTKFNRPADADRCVRNLAALTNSYLG